MGFTITPEVPTLEELKAMGETGTRLLNWVVRGTSGLCWGTFLDET